MGFSTFIELNHDAAGSVHDEPEAVGRLLYRYMCACNKDDADELEHRFGIKVWKSGNRGGWEDDIRAAMAD